MNKHLLLSKLKAIAIFMVNGSGYGEGWRDGSGESYNQYCGDNVTNEYAQVFRGITYHSYSTLQDCNNQELPLDTRLTE